MVTNFYAEVDVDICTGCETCIQICPMEAIELKDDVAKVMLKRCIGCGNCVPKCPSEAINLHKRERQFIPFPTMDALFDKIMERKLTLEKQNKN
jgi:heterodisulfide reductase subunit A-like polyferredoxin